MATKGAIEVGRRASKSGELSRRLQRVLLAVAAGILLAGTVALSHDPQMGFLAAALILGWTQLVGL